MIIIMIMIIIIIIIIIIIHIFLHGNGRRQRLLFTRANISLTSKPAESARGHAVSNLRESQKVRAKVKLLL